MNIPRPVVASVVGSLTIATSSLSSATVTVTSSSTSSTSTVSSDPAWRTALVTTSLTRSRTVSTSPENPASCSTPRSEEHTSELQSLMRNSYAVFCLKKTKQTTNNTHSHPD